ncbi:FABP family protein [Herbiconiux flava]|uniref:Peroxynitrite isomerase n=1 Tax=Herbiconiux flava TaxID=881268 RepID=A0A852SNN5_9MICO|nr:FABP family protein [Herbiconiux flava]NYD70414.1 hypothetical protein [Herbiconiux flava]GLK17169.1 hypothetical protein GCM10017602_16510 [Herbiconiux flava]
MIEIPTGLPAELVPLSWLIGVWEGTGVIDYAIDPPADAEEGTEPTRVSREFGQRISFSHDGLPFLNYSSSSWLLPVGDETEPTPLTAETGYWRLSRLHIEGDAGPGMLPGEGPRPFNTAQSVETLRNAAEGFDIEVAIVHPTGVSELYLGQVKGPRIDLATDAVVRTRSAKEYAAATRLYGLVDNHLLWAWDIAALGQDLRTHASARLAKVD